GQAQLVGFAAHDAPDVLGLITWLMKDQLIARVEAQIDELADDENALDDAARVRREGDLLAEILVTERLEEATIEAFAADGLSVPRRDDADFRAVLGITVVEGELC